MQLIPIFRDDYGQSMYFFFKGKCYSCGTFNPDETEELKDIVDHDLDLFQVITKFFDDGDSISVEVMKKRGFHSRHGHLYFKGMGEHAGTIIDCDLLNYHDKVENEILKFKIFLMNRRIHWLETHQSEIAKPEDPNPNNNIQE